MRPVGQRIIFLLNLLDTEGPLSYKKISEYMNFVSKQNVSKYLSRAIKMDFVLKIEVSGVNIYTVVDGWTDKLHKYKSNKIKPVKKVIQYKRPANSVWEFCSN